MSDLYKEFISIIRSKDIYQEKELQKMEKDVEKFENKILKEANKKSEKAINDRMSIIIPWKGVWAGKEKTIIKKNIKQQQFFNLELPLGLGYEIIKEINVYDNELEEDTYVGNYYYGLYHGLGRKTYFSRKNTADNPFTTPSYVGNWVCGTEYGLGIQTTSESTHRGNFKYGQIDGFGTNLTESKRTGWVINGIPFGFNLEINRDEKNKFITDESKPSGLYLYEGNTENLKKSLLYPFKNEKEYNNIKIIKDKKKLNETNVLTRQLKEQVNKWPKYSKEERDQVFDTKLLFNLMLYDLFHCTQNFKVKKDFIKKIDKFRAFVNEYYEVINMVYSSQQNVTKKSRKIINDHTKLYNSLIKELEKTLRIG